MELAQRARSDATTRAAAADRGSLPLRGRGAPHAAAHPDPARSAPARPDRARRPGLPLLGPRPRDARTADMLSSLAGVYTFHHDPGELSAAFVWERTQRLLLSPQPARAVRHRRLDDLVDALERRARSAGRADRDRRARRHAPRPAGDRRARARRRPALLDDDTSAVAERPHGLPRPRPARAPRRPVDRLRPAERRLDRALHRAGPVAGTRRRAARPGPDADPPRREPPRTPAPDSSSCSTHRSRNGASGSPGAAAR